jgi:D-glycero-alpha-D-manno-heptose 1-phosphate guanylyltransferase
VIRSTEVSKTPVREAIVLAGGKGTRLRSHVNDRPKPMADVGGRPFVEWLLLMMLREGIERVILCTGFMSEIIHSHFADVNWHGLEIVCVKEPQPLGTGGALRNALDAIQTDICLVLNGDSYCSLDLKYMYSRFASQDVDVSILLTGQDDVSRYGTVSTDSEGFVTSFKEKENKKNSGNINAGIYLMKKTVIAQIAAGREYSLERDFLPNKINEGIGTTFSLGPFVDIGTPVSYAGSLNILRSELSGLGEGKLWIE